MREMDDARCDFDRQETLRVTVPEIEEILYKTIPVLDKGFIRVVDYMGNDEAIVQAARVSYGRGTKKSLEDKGLINYLMRHSHTTPFEMCEIKLHVKLPIFVARQWVRHRTASVNEYSARYSILDKEFYIPSHEVLASQSSHNKQGRESDTLSSEEAKEVLDILNFDANRCYEGYRSMLNFNEDGSVVNPDKHGIARELARMNLTLNYYTQWYWKINLHNLLHFTRLRADPHAQFEIREYAKAILEVIEKWVPYAFDAFMNYKVKGSSFSSKEMEILQKLIKGEKVIPEGMSKREIREFEQKLDIKL